MEKRILITGCSSGIGYALTTELSGRGHKVISTARQTEALQDLPAVQKLFLDVCDERSIASAITAAGRIDILINNAGFGFWGPVESASGEAVSSLFDTNVFGPLRVIRAVLPAMRAQGSGAIIQISSAVAHRSNMLLGHYAASKAALEAYSEALRIELASFGIRVSIVGLGAVETDFGQNRQHVHDPVYTDLIENASERIQSNRKNPASAESVACVIADAIDADHLPLRIDGTPDASQLVAQRRALDDETWERNTLESLYAQDIKNTGKN